MPRLNDVRLYAYMLNPPKIFCNDDGVPISASFTTIVANGRKDVSDDSLLSLSYDYPFIYTKNPRMIKEIQGIKVGDFVRIEGMLCSKSLCNKASYCTCCGAKNVLQGTIVYIYPTYIEVDKGEKCKNQEEAFNVLRKKHMISNRVLAMGTVLEQPILYQNKGHVTNTGYRLAIGRSIKIAEDMSNIMTDYPRIAVFGKNAVMDAKCLYEGSLVMVNGYIQTREFERNVECETCHQTYSFTEASCEIVSKFTEYLENYNTPEDIEVESELEAKEVEKKYLSAEEDKKDLNSFFESEEEEDYDDDF